MIRDRVRLLGLSALIALAAGWTRGVASTPDSSNQPGAARGRDVRYVVIHSPGPKWIPGKTVFEQPGLDEHIAHYRQLLEQGKLLAGGPFLDSAGGGMMVPEPGLSEREITDFAQADPAVKTGLLKFEVRPWLLGMKKG